MKNEKQKPQELGGVIKNDIKNYPRTGEWSQKKPEISDKCIVCKQCLKICPEGVLGVEKNEGREKIRVDYDYCKGCGICAENCPVKAISMKNK